MIMSSNHLKKLKKKMWDVRRDLKIRNNREEVLIVTDHQKISKKYDIGVQTEQ